MSYCRIHDRSMNVFNECSECEHKRDTIHKCPDDTVLFCKECAPKRGGDYCGACFFRKDELHIWWCWKNQRRES